MSVLGIMLKRVCTACPMISDMKKGIDNNVKRAVKIRLEVFLEKELESFEHYKTHIKGRGKITPTRQKQVERYYRKRISALRIVIYICTPTMERDSDIPNLF